MPAIRSAAVTSLLLILNACGGGGGGSAESPFLPLATLASIGGIAAAGAVMANSEVVIKDSTGATVATTTTGSDGSYTTGVFVPTRYTAPFVVSVTGQIGASSETFVSVLGSTPTMGTIVNVSPITNAISASLASTGNPVDLLNNITTEKNNITVAAIAAAESAYRTVLASNLTAAGVHAATNLISGQFNTNFDKLLDNIKVDVTPTGVVSLSTLAGSAINDLGEGGAAPAAAKSVTLAKGVLPASGDIANLPAAPNGSAAISVSSMETIRTALNTCYALPASSRTLASGACSNLVTSDYRHSGRTAAVEFGTTVTLSLSATENNNLSFKTVEILRQLDTTPNAERIIVRFNGTRSDHTPVELITVAANNPTANAGWTLVGDQREFYTKIDPFGSYFIRPNTLNNEADRLESGLGVFIRYHSSIKNAVVTGPGLPNAGLKLIARSACDALTIASPDSPDTAPQNCVSGYKLGAWLVVSGAVFVSSTHTYLYNFSSTATTAELETAIKAIPPLSVYKFVITKTDNTTVTYYNRLVNRPPILAELKARAWPTFTPASYALMTVATLYSGGAAPTVSWTTPSGAGKPFVARFAHVNGNDSVPLPFSVNSVAIPCTGNTDCSASGASYLTTLANGVTAASQYQFELATQNRFGVVYSAFLKR